MKQSFTPKRGVAGEYPISLEKLRFMGHIPKVGFAVALGATAGFGKSILTG